MTTHYFDNAADRKLVATAISAISIATGENHEGSVFEGARKLSHKAGSLRDLTDARLVEAFSDGYNGQIASAQAILNDYGMGPFATAYLAGLSTRQCRKVNDDLRAAMVNAVSAYHAARSQKLARLAGERRAA